MLWRGVRRRCPRCGSTGALATWFRMAERCPSCRLRFERENDFYLGAYVVNFAVTEGLLFVALLVFVVRLNADPETSWLPIVVVGVVVAVGAPLAFFPFSRTIWAAIDLAMRPVFDEDEAVTKPEVDGGGA